MKQTRTEISAIGEFGLIDRIRRVTDIAPADPIAREHLLKGIGDDAAVFRPGPGSVELVSVDTFVEGIHFDLTYTSFSHLGWKAVAASLSDIAAMGGSPRYVLLTLAIPAKISVEMLDEFYSGAAAACKKYSCLIVGGDTAASVANFSVAATVIGEAPGDGVIYRKGAKEGDYICVTGHLGASIAGLKVLQREKQKFLASGNGSAFEPNLEPYKTAIEKHLVPKPRFDISSLFAGKVKVHSMVDISDGLASEVHHLCRAGDVGATIYEHNLPIEPLTQRIADEFSARATDYALYGGEEYELLFTMGDAEQKQLEKLTNDVSIIGRITPAGEGVNLVREQGEKELLRPGGWNHFTKE
jgi:thiamine-monophosphate kinase